MRETMKKLKTVLPGVLLAALGLLVFVIAPASAATGDGGNGMRVSPVRTDLTIQPGGSKTISVYVRNVTGANATYQVIKNDFVASTDESGSPALLLNGQSNDQHGLKNYMTSVNTVSVPAGQQREVKVTISLPKGIAGGGYYGAIRFAPSVPGSNGKNLSLTGSVGSLVLIRVPGNVSEKLSLVSFDARKDNAPKTIFTTPKGISGVVRFRNEGNIQEQPFGKIILKKGNKTLETHEINTGDLPGNVLPDSVRRFTINLSKVGSFGKYTLIGNFGYGSDGQLLSAKTTFYVIPLWLIIIGLAIVALILFLIFGLPKLVRRYNQRVIRNARRSKR